MEPRESDAVLQHWHTFGGQSFGGGNSLTLNSFLPLTTGRWWYPTAYALFLVFYPFYQRALQSMERKEVRNLIFTMAALWTIPTIVPMKLELGAGNTACFFMLYAIVFYVRKFQPLWANDKKRLAWITLGGYALAFLSIFVLDALGTRLSSINEYACYYIRGDWRILPVVISVAMFLWISQTNMRYNQLINWFGGLTFAVYLVHMHPIVIKILFKGVFVLEPYIGSWTLVPYVVGVTLLVFCGCALVDAVRKGLYSFLRLLCKSVRD